MNPTILLGLLLVGVWLASSHRSRGRPARNPYNPRRRRRPGAGQLELPERSSADDYRERQAALRAELDRLRDETPNLRDFGLDRREDFDRAIEAHGRRVRALQNERERLGYEFRGLPVPERFRNPRRRRPGAAQLELPEAPSAYPVYHVAGGGKLPNRKKQPFWVFAQWAGVSSSDNRWFTHDPVGRSFSSYAEAADVARELARRSGGVVEDSREARRRLLSRNPYNPPRRRNPTAWSTSDRPPQGMSRGEFLKRLRLRSIGNGYYVRQDVAGTGWTLVYPSGDTRSGHRTRAAAEVRAQRHRAVVDRNPRRVQTSAQCCRCGSGYPCRPNPYSQACRIGTGHVWDFRHGGRCECCGRAAPKRLVTLEWDRTGEHTNYGRTCAGRAIGTTKLRTNQLAHMDQEASHRSARESHYRGAGARSGIVRPTFARGWSEHDITELARRVGESPFEPGWWLSQTANLVPGHYERRRVVGDDGQVGYVRGRYIAPSGEFRRFVLEGGQRAQKRQRGGAARSARPTRARAAAPSARYDDLPF